MQCTSIPHYTQFSRYQGNGEGLKLTKCLPICVSFTRVKTKTECEDKNWIEMISSFQTSKTVFLKQNSVVKITWLFWQNKWQLKTLERLNHEFNPWNKIMVSFNNRMIAQSSLFKNNWYLIAKQAQTTISN